MRSFKITVVLFLILMICIIFNSLYIHRCADSLTEKAEAILNGGQTQELKVFWETNKKYIGISISEAQLDNISRLITVIDFNQRQGNRQELETNIALFTDAVEGMRRYEKISIQNIF